MASMYPFDGFVVVRRKRDWWGKYLWKRARRQGFGKTLNEVALRAYWVLFKGAEEHRQVVALTNEVKRRIPSDYKRPPITYIANINSEDGRAKLRSLKPDVCVLMLHPILAEKTFTIPPLGMLVFHPGVTPEYRGPHAEFWAVMLNEFWGIGWSLLRVDKGIDTGPVLAEGTCYSANPFEDTHVMMGHKSHIEGIPAVVEVLKQLERGEFPTVKMVNRRSMNHTHPGITDYIRYRKQIEKLKAGLVPPGHPKPEGVL
jgi:methionyl-tRNA formyltransferase